MISTDTKLLYEISRLMRSKLSAHTDRLEYMQLNIHVSANVAA